ncbi:GH23813 [Drosophila grimshawi]|uniref:GH23813 n=1 Tax=Drosophila grimshawi TaxID=7222 RepID=B4K1T3_DROGR|nr:GH23813 [Drosophila grimshawi]
MQTQQQAQLPKLQQNINAGQFVKQPVVKPAVKPLMQAVKQPFKQIVKQPVKQTVKQIVKKLSKSHEMQPLQLSGKQQPGLRQQQPPNLEQVHKQQTGGVGVSLTYIQVAQGVTAPVKARNPAQNHLKKFQQQLQLEQKQHQQQQLKLLQL